MLTYQVKYLKNQKIYIHLRNMGPNEPESVNPTNKVSEINFL